MFAPRLVALTLVLLTFGSAERIIQQHGLQDSEEECSEDTCDTFSKEHTSCSCGQFSAWDDGLFLTLRAKRTLFNMAQSLRYITDYETTKSFLQGLWLPTKLQNAKLLQASLKDFRYVQSATRALRRFTSFVGVPVKDLLQREIPAGAMPILVEVWEKTSAFKKNAFIGEAGLDTFPVGPQELELRPNPSRSEKTAKIAEKKVLGYVSVETEYSNWQLVPCADRPQERCLNCTLKVTCKSARDIPVEGLTDAYCKVRFKEKADKGSTKDKTPVSKSDPNPVWTEGNTFTYSWQARAISIGEQVVPWSISHMNLLQQFQANMQYMVETKALKGKSCNDPSLKKTKQQQMLCDTLAGDVRQDACDEVKTKMSPEDQNTMDGMVDDIRSGASLLEELNNWDDYDKDGNKKKAVAGATAFVGICIILMIVLIIMLR